MSNEIALLQSLAAGEFDSARVLGDLYEERGDDPWPWRWIADWEARPRKKTLEGFGAPVAYSWSSCYPQLQNRKVGFNYGGAPGVPHSASSSDFLREDWPTIEEAYLGLYQQLHEAGRVQYVSKFEGERLVEILTPRTQTTRYLKRLRRWWLDTGFPYDQEKRITQVPLTATMDTRLVVTRQTTVHVLMGKINGLTGDRFSNSDPIEELGGADLDCSTHVAVGGLHEFDGNWIGKRACLWCWHWRPLVLRNLFLGVEPRRPTAIHEEILGC